MELTLLDYIVFFVFVVGVTLLGCSFYLKSSKGASAFTAAEGTLPAWGGGNVYLCYVRQQYFVSRSAGRLVCGKLESAGLQPHDSLCYKERKSRNFFSLFSIVI